MTEQIAKPTMASPLPAVTHLFAGGAAGIMEACLCHPLDTVKVRMQLLRKDATSGVRYNAPNATRAPKLTISKTNKLGIGSTFSRIVRSEGLFALYKGFDAVLIGMGPKMAVRFASFEAYKTSLQSLSGELNRTAIFAAGLGAGVTEAIFVVSPMEVVKIRLQGQNSVPGIGGTAALPQYRNALHAAVSVAWHEGIGALYQGVALTALRQGTNQAANFSVYTALKARLTQYQPSGRDPPSYQTAAIGLVSGAVGPLCNAPIDTIKTRMQNSVRISGESGLQKGIFITMELLQREGVRAFYKGITPRVIRVAPGQAITFTVYEFVKKQLE